MAKYLDLQIQETSLKAQIKDAINRFVRTGSVNKGKSPVRPSQDSEQLSYEEYEKYSKQITNGKECIIISVHA